MLVCKFNVSKDLKGPTENLDKQLKVGTRLPSSLDPNEEERAQGALLIQKAWMFAWLVHAELTAETARDWPVQARGHPFQVQLSSSVRFLRPTVIRVLCASATGHVHSSREAEPLSEDIALLLLAESHQWQTYLTSTKFPRDFAPPGVLRLARHKFRCQKPYKDKTAKIPYAGTADSLRSLRALIKITSSKRTLGPLKELKEMKKGQVLLPPEVPDCRSNPLSREPRPSVLPPATRKRGASTSVHRPRKVQRILDMSTVFEEPTDFDHSGTREPSRPYSLIQGTHQHPLPAQGLLGPVQTDSGIHGTFLTPEAGGNLSREPGSCKSFPLTPESLDHLQSAEGPDDLSISAHEMFDPLPLTQGTLGILVYSSGLMAPSESEHRTLGHVSSVGKDGEISPFEKPTRSTSPLTPYLPFNREVLESSS
ncbi:hypothetical protein ACRRTK_025028 [Alexandromys fortis]